MVRSAYLSHLGADPPGASSTSLHYTRRATGPSPSTSYNVSTQASSASKTTLTAKPHAFSGAVLTPKHARELSPSVVLAITHALSEQATTRNIHLPDSSAAVATNGKVQYTVWITEAWRVLGWAEPSAALFWEMATMYHTLHVAGRETHSGHTLPKSTEEGGVHIDIPPILSCGSSNSLGSDTYSRGNTSPARPISPNNSTLLDSKRTSMQSNKSTVASAKELPVWLVGMFLLLHCEERAFLRNVSGEDERRFDVLSKGGGGGLLGMGSGDHLLSTTSGDFSALMMMNPSLSPRTRIHAGQHNDNCHCTSFLLRNLRKFLLLTAVPHNSDALWAIMTLADSKTADSEYAHRRNKFNNLCADHLSIKPDVDELRSRHEEEHGDIGLHVKLGPEDLERLNLVLQAPSGGLIDDSPLRIAENILRMYGSADGGATITVEAAELELRRHLEIELMHLENVLVETNSGGGGPNDKETAIIRAASKLGKLSLNDGEGKEVKEGVSVERKRNKMIQMMEQLGLYKDLSYNNLRGTTILLKPNSHPDNIRAGSAANSVSSDVVSNNPFFATNGRLHDLQVSDCSDAHIYLLQPFEHATVSACTGCTIVVGAVAGLLHVVDCERTVITSAARRVLVSNCFDVLHCIFTPSPPLLVGDNRSCQFAPYNTYYDGLREDLLATGLAAALVNPDHLPYVWDGQGPALQCASNKWKQPVELAKLEIPQVHPQTLMSSPPTTSSNSAGGSSDDKPFSKPSGADDSMQTPILLPASEFHVLFVPLESELAKQRRIQQEATLDDMALTGNDDNFLLSGPPTNNKAGCLDSQYCRNLADVLQLSPFRLPAEYERRALVKADRMRSLQQAIQTDLSSEQQLSLEEELNRGFRDWLVTSGNLRQVLDLVHMERKGAV